MAKWPKSLHPIVLFLLEFSLISSVNLSAKGTQESVEPALSAEQNATIGKIEDFGTWLQAECENFKVDVNEAKIEERLLMKSAESKIYRENLKFYTAYIKSKSNWNDWYKWKSTCIPEKEIEQALEVHTKRKHSLFDVKIDEIEKIVASARDYFKEFNRNVINAEEKGEEFKLLTDLTNLLEQLRLNDGEMELLDQKIKEANEKNGEKQPPNANVNTFEALRNLHVEANKKLMELLKLIWLQPHSDYLRKLSAQISEDQVEIKKAFQAYIGQLNKAPLFDLLPRVVWDVVFNMKGKYLKLITSIKMKKSLIKSIKKKIVAKEKLIKGKDTVEQKALGNVEKNEDLDILRSDLKRLFKYEYPVNFKMHVEKLDNIHKSTPAVEDSIKERMVDFVKSRVKVHFDKFQGEFDQQTTPEVMAKREQDWMLKEVVGFARTFVKNVQVYLREKVNVSEENIREYERFRANVLLNSFSQQMTGLLALNFEYEYNKDKLEQDKLYHNFAILTKITEYIFPNFTTMEQKQIIKLSEAKKHGPIKRAFRKIVNYDLSAMEQETNEVKYEWKENELVQRFNECLTILHESIPFGKLYEKANRNPYVGTKSGDQLPQHFVLLDKKECKTVEKDDLRFRVVLNALRTLALYSRLSSYYTVLNDSKEVDEHSRIINQEFDKLHENVIKEMGDCHVETFMEYIFGEFSKHFDKNMHIDGKNGMKKAEFAKEAEERKKIEEFKFEKGKTSNDLEKGKLN